MKHETDGGRSAATSCDLPLSTFTLTRPNGETFDPDPDLSKTARNSAGLLFEVPANLERATVRVSADRLTCYPDSAPGPWTTQEPARITLTVPAQ